MVVSQIRTWVPEKILRPQRQAEIDKGLRALMPKLARKIREVVSERERRRIQLPTARHDWTMREIRLLGRFNDHETARRLNRSYDAVRLLRINLGIPALRPLPKGRVWTRAEDRLLGTLSDKQQARRLQRTWVLLKRGAFCSRSQNAMPKHTNGRRKKMRCSV